MAVDYADFVNVVEEEGDLEHSDAERAVLATLETLGERLSDGECRDVAQDLPEEVRSLLAEAPTAEAFGIGEFVQRISRREGVEATTAALHARAVFIALGRTVSPAGLDDMAAELADDYDPLLAAADLGRPPDQADDEAAPFLDKVAEYANLDRDAARHATDAVLETLGERISRGEVKDLEELLPITFHGALDRGDELSNGAARPMALKDFLRRIAEREGVDLDQAREHARAVFRTLRETVGEKEFNDVVAQLPDEYAPILARS
jgi:uncharacterized protein (DUF2267 family)